MAAIVGGTRRGEYRIRGGVVVNPGLIRLPASFDTTKDDVVELHWLDDPEGGDESGFDGESLCGNLFSRVSLPALRASSCFRYPACPSACSLPLVTPLAAPVCPCPRFASSSRAARLVQSLCSIEAILTRLGFSVRSKRVRGESCLFSEYA